jgi:hypothetical protein
MTNLKNMDFVDLLENIHGASDADLLYDVKLIVQDVTGAERGAIKAHKLLLSFISPVFKRQFFGMIKEEGNGNNDGGSSIAVVPVRASSFSAFEKMIRYIYSGDQTIVTAIQELNDLFELFRLADMYMITGLKMLVREAIDKFPVSSENYAEVFRLIREFESLLNFDEICLGLSTRVAVTVSAEWKSVDDSVRFWSTDYGDDQLTKLLLMKKLQLAREKANFCLECKVPKDSCLDGKALTDENCKVGLRVKALTTLTSVHGWSIAADTTGMIKEQNTTGYVHSPYHSNNAAGRLSVLWNGGNGYPNIYNSMANMVICIHDKEKS